MKDIMQNIVNDTVKQLHILATFTQTSVQTVMTHFDNEITDLKSARQLDDSRFAALRCDIRD